jgi:hypothetical protein
MADKVVVTLVLSLCMVLCLELVATDFIGGQVIGGGCYRLEMKFNIYLVVIKRVV